MKPETSYNNLSLNSFYWFFWCKAYKQEFYIYNNIDDTSFGDVDLGKESTPVSETEQGKFKGT